MAFTLTNDDVILEADQAPAGAPAAGGQADILVCLPALSPEALTSALDIVVTAFANRQVLVASTHPSDGPSSLDSITLIPYATDHAAPSWVLAASDYAAAARLAVEHNSTTLLLLSEAPANAALLTSLAASVGTGNVDFAVPRFHLGPNDGLVNAALLYPLSRSLFGADIRFPLPAAAALSGRMAQRLATTTQRLVSLNQGSAIVWPIAEAAIAGFSARQVDAPAGAVPPSPTDSDFNTLFATVAGSLFSDIETKAAFWQRARSLPVRTLLDAPVPTLEAAIVSPDILSIIESFHLAQANLQEIWSLVLPPQSRLALKKLSQLPAAEFAMDAGLWARIVYDFALAFHLRILNRNHLLGAMTPLYLAWVASHLRTVADDPARAAQTIEQTAAAFETEKSYFVSRWRWPDRFNP